MQIAYDAKRLFNNFTGLGNYSRTLIDMLTARFPDNTYLLYTPKISDANVVKPYRHKEHCSTRMPEGLVRGSLWRGYGLAKEPIFTTALVMSYQWVWALLEFRQW